MGRADYYKPGDWNAECSMCGHKFKAGELIRHWQGEMRCKKCWETRHPQDFVKSIPDNPTVPFVQKYADIDRLFCTIEGRIAIPGLAIPGCAIPGNLIGLLEMGLTLKPPVIAPISGVSYFGSFYRSSFGSYFDGAAGGGDNIIVPPTPTPGLHSYFGSSFGSSFGSYFG